MRRFVWMTLQAAGVLSLTACFTFVDFELGDGAGGAGTGGSATASPTSATGSSMVMGGSGGEGGQSCEGDLSSDDENCGACNHSCAGGTCSAGICGAVAYFTADSDIVSIGAGGPHVVILEKVSQNLVFLPIGSSASPQPLDAMKGTGVWNVNGQGIAVDDEGAAYYAPQTSTPTEHPITRCALIGACADAFGVSEPYELARFQLNALQFHEGRVYGISPNTGKVWRAQPGQPQAQVFFTLTLSNTPLALGFGLAFGGGNVAASTVGRPGDDPPVAAYLGVAETATLPQNQYKVAASEVAFPWRVVTSLAIGEAGVPYARAFLDDGASQRGVVLRGEELLTYAFGDIDLTNAVTADTMGGLVADESDVYLYGERSGLNFMRCPTGEDPRGDACTSLAGEKETLFSTGPVVATDELVFFADGPTLYRVVK